jgi:hypothetical protein
MQPLNEFRRPLNEFRQPLNELTQPLNELTQLLKEFASPLNEFMQPLNEFRQLLSAFMPSLNEFAKRLNDVSRFMKSFIKDMKHVMSHMKSFMRFLTAGKSLMGLAHDRVGARRGKADTRRWRFRSPREILTGAHSYDESVRRFAAASACFLVAFVGAARVAHAEIIDVRAPVRVGWGWSDLFHAGVLSLSFEDELALQRLGESGSLHLVFGMDGQRGIRVTFSAGQRLGSFAPVVGYW